MKNLIEDRRSRGRMILAISFVLLVVFGNARSARAQMTGPDGNNNIYYNAGNVGIGTTSPGVKLDIGGAGNSQLFRVQPTSTTTGYSSMSHGNSGGVGYWLQESSSGGTMTGGLPYATVMGSATNTATQFMANSVVNLTLLANGKVGVGTTSPGVLFQVGNGGTNQGIASIMGSSSVAPLLYLDNSNIPGGRKWELGFRAIASKLSLYDITDSVYGMTWDAGGNVGIGTTSPAQPLDVIGNIRVTNELRTGNGFYIGASANSTTNGVNSSGTNLQFRTNGIDSRMVIDSSGNVGIGTASPGYKLDVNGNTNITGNITASGTINAKYQDVAEWVPSSEQLSAGTVVVLDSTKSNQVTSSSVSYDTRVAGVVSEQPGIALGEQRDGKVLVATTGRVYVKVDASKDPIHIGDLLVTSDVPGMAMKSEPIIIGSRQLHAPGTLIGKALEPLEKGRGSILVLLSLQ